MQNYYNNISHAVLAACLLCVASTAQAEPPTEEKAGEVVQEAQALFDILEFRVTGNSVLESSIIEQTVYPMMGEGKSIADVEKARAELEKVYHTAGYLTVLVDIPEQDVEQGIVRLNVTEGRVGRLRVQGSRYYSLGRIQERAPSLAEGEIPHFPQVQQDMTGLNRTADKRVTPVMKAGKEFGTVEVDLKVEDNLPLHASIELNDRYSRDTERWRLAGMVRYDNLWQREHSLTLQFQTAPQDTEQVQVLSASYLYRFDNSDKMLAFYGVKSESSVASVGGINVLGNGSIYGARLILPLPALERYYHSISMGVDYKDFEDNIRFGADTASIPVSYLPWSIQYSATAQDSKGATEATLGLSFGLRDVVGTDEEFDAKRVGAKSNFLVLKPELERTQNMLKGLQLWARLDGQIANGPLISNEQYSAGGVESVRGYLESESLGDHALHASLELRSPALHRGEWLQELRLFGFYDHAMLIDIDETGTEGNKREISGVGFGVSLKLWKHWNAKLALARALHEGETTEEGEVSGHMRFWYEF